MIGDRLWKGRISFDLSNQRFRTLIDGENLHCGFEPAQQLHTIGLMYAFTDDDWGDDNEELMALLALNGTRVVVKDFSNGELWVRPDNASPPIEMPDHFKAHEGRFFIGRFEL